MSTKLDRIFPRFLVALLPFQTACVSLQHQPDPATLTNSASCEAINGSYNVDSLADGRVLADSLFDIDEVVGALAIEKSATRIIFRASDVKGQALPAVSFYRFSCTESILKLILSEESPAGGGPVMATSNRVLELFVSGRSSLNLRLIDTNLAFFFLIPYYGSRDELVTLQKQPIGVGEMPALGR